MWVLQGRTGGTMDGSRPHGLTSHGITLGASMSKVMAVWRRDQLSSALRLHVVYVCSAHATKNVE